ncbi:MAG: tRNA 2-selenouridine(34) synthase MnmH [Betaproteobacteria bacterium]
MRSDVATVDDLGAFDAVIDVRSPSEFAEDHVPGALNCPVLDDAERALVGTLYKQDSPFAARRVGAAIVARNIARHLDASLAAHPRGWRPLVYCWRGGKRSGAMTHVLREVGWDARQLDGGYKSYRRHVVADLAVLPGRFALRVICGLTGSGKSRLLAELARQGAQVLDLEGMAAHRGSVLGALPDEPQPAQKRFESRLLEALRALDFMKPVFVESESKKIGALHVPEALIERMWASPCVRVETAPDGRVALLMEEYAHFFVGREVLAARLKSLAPLHGHETIGRWLQHVAAGQWEPLVADLLARHYDPSYTRSITGHYPGYGTARRVYIADISASAFAAAAREILSGEPVTAP